MSEDWRLECFYHTIINAKDIDETVAFYEDLGFEIISERRNMQWPYGGWTHFGLTPNTTGRGGVLMALPDDPDGPMLDIIQFFEPKAIFNEISPTTIPRITAFRCRNVTAAMKAMQAKGYRTASLEPISIKAAGIMACGCIYDPNGNIVELMELAPGLRTSKLHEVYAPGKKLD